MMSLSVVVPVHNEAGSVELLMAEIHQALVGQTAYEMIFVDDGSTDDTLPILKQNLPTYPALRVLTHRQACGQSRAVHTGVAAARFDWVATLDGDRQNDPADIPTLIDELARHNNDRLWMLAGFRHRRNDTGWRRFTSRLANVVRQAILHDQTPDSGCGLKLFRRDTFLALPYFDHIHRFLPAMIRMTGGEVVSVKVHHRPRSQGHSKYGTLDRLLAGVIDLLGVVWLQKRHSLPVISEVHHER